MTANPENLQSERLYRLILDNALDSFIAFDTDSRILEWSHQAELAFGWSREEAIGMSVVDTVIPERYRAAHLAELRRYLETGTSKLMGRRVELFGRRKDGGEFPIELGMAPIRLGEHIIFSASIKDISRRKGLEQQVHRQASITRSILDNMADAVVVAEASGRVIMVNPAGQHLLNLDPAEQNANQYFRNYPLFHTDCTTPYRVDLRPTARALRGEHVNGLIGWVKHENLEAGVWVRVNARPLTDRAGAVIGAVVAFHDITELREREETLQRQALLLQEQASLLDLSHDAIMVRDLDDVITYWNHSAETLYGYRREEALGRVAHRLLATVFPVPPEEIRDLTRKRGYWEGQLVQTIRDGRRITVFSQWTLEMQDGQPLRYLETNMDITQRLEAERALHESQEDYRLLVDAATDFAIITADTEGTILSWNTGAEKILGFSPEEAVGRPLAEMFTPEDRDSGTALQELQEAAKTGRAGDDRWHIKRDGSRFWASGAVMPLRRADGSLRGFVKIVRDLTRQRLAEEQMRFFAHHDMLTGLPNRVHFSNELHKSVARTDRSGIPFAILMFDLDKFKEVNDTYGHHAGDLLLKEVAARILSALRETDFVARLGGDEFVAIQSDASQPAAAETLARKLVLELGRPYDLEGNEVISGASIGIATYPIDAKSSVEVIKRADLALYRAKHAGRGTYQFYTPDFLIEESWKKDREQALRDALQRGQFSLYYQPQVDLRTWRIATVEALLRWQASEMELVLPNDFLDVAEESGLIVEIGEWALREACRQVKKWQDWGLSDLRLSLNCSARQFSDPGFVEAILPVMEQTGMDANCLELEVAESMLVQHPQVKRQLAALRHTGVRITIDNYGTGAASLIDFKEFEIDSLKIDKAFVQHLPHRRKDAAIASAIINLAHDLGISVSAGGVETAEQLAYLKEHDCTNAQGFIFSPPIPPEKFEELMLNGTWSRINRLPHLDDNAPSKGLH